MARYACSFTVAIDIERLRQLLSEILQSCHLDVMYDNNGYIKARESPHRVSLSKLVTVEVFIARTATETATRMDLVIRNEELSLQVDNHCHQMFDLVKQSLLNYRSWQLVENVVS